MKSILSTALLIGLFLFSFVVNAQALIIDFEDVAISSGSNIIGGDFSSGGAFFDSQTDHRHLMNNAFGLDNGGTWAVFEDYQGDSNTTITLNSGLPFNLNYLNYTPFDDGSGGFATVLAITGMLSGGGTVIGNIANDNPNSFVGYGFGSNWSNLTSIIINGQNNTGYFAIDNIDLTPVPEPSTFLLLGGGLAGLALVARRKKKE